MSRPRCKKKKKLDFPRQPGAPASDPPRSRHSRLSEKLLNWYDHNRRDLPWRATPAGHKRPHPYSVLVSEFMLQQTQVATVIPYFQRFMSRFPTLASLASAHEQDVLLHWQGLGYYSRARNLQAAAQKIVHDFDSHIPTSVTELLTLPGIGRYTAGAIASISYGVKAPIVDGNVTRVLSRLDKICSDSREPATAKRLWARAEELLPDDRAGDFNSALMELGATVCTPRSPKCSDCPIRKDCLASAANMQESIPAPRRAAPTGLFRRWTLCLSRNGRWLIERRPPRGRWAGLWQFITIDAGAVPATTATLNRQFNLTLSDVKRLGQIRHALTHRRYQFDVFVAHAGREAKSTQTGPRRWVKLDQLNAFPLSRPQLRIAQMLQTLTVKP
jgi:A/G-specific adenine glycosylase